MTQEDTMEKKSQETQVDISGISGISVEGDTRDIGASFIAKEKEHEYLSLIALYAEEESMNRDIKYVYILIPYSSFPSSATIISITI